MSYYGFDNSYMLDVIRRQPDVFRGIAVVDCMLDQPDAQIRRLAACGVRGLRIELSKEFSSSSAESAGLDRLFRAAAHEMLAVCPLMVPDALPALRQFCCRHPDTTVVIDHLAGIGDGAPVSDADVSALCSFAALPQVQVKLSGFYTVGKGPPHLDMLPLIKPVYEAFGPRRLMWGSDAPFQMMGETYEDSISLVRDRLDFASADDREWMLRGTAERVFFQ
jgi:predicted TIM-barrel fold metal-dependent hydrolase